MKKQFYSLAIYIRLKANSTSNVIYGFAFSRYLCWTRPTLCLPTIPPVKRKRFDGLDVPRCEPDTRLASNRNAFLTENRINLCLNVVDRSNTIITKVITMLKGSIVLKLTVNQPGFCFWGGDVQGTIAEFRSKIILFQHVDYMEMANFNDTLSMTRIYRT